MNLDPNAMPDQLAAAMSPETMSWLIDLATNLGMALITVIIGWWAAGWFSGMVKNALKRVALDEAISRFLSNMVRYIIITVVIVSAMERLGIQTTSVMAVLASAGLAVGLALQGSLTNFASGVMILLFKPFGLQDVVTAGGSTGVVIDIGLFATALMKVDGTKVIVPNGDITGGVLENHTVLGKRRGTVDIGVDYGVDLEQARAALTRAAQNVPEILEDPGFAVAFVSFGGSSLDWQVHAWSAPKDYLPMLEKLRCNIYDELNKANIGIPFPQLVVHKAEAEAAEG